MCLGILLPVHQGCAVPEKARRGHQIPPPPGPPNWSFGLLATRQVLGIEFGSPRSALNERAISLAPRIFSLVLEESCYKAPPHAVQTQGAPSALVKGLVLSACNGSLTVSLVSENTDRPAY